MAGLRSRAAEALSVARLTSVIGIGKRAVGTDRDALAQVFKVLAAYAVTAGRAGPGTALGTLRVAGLADVVLVRIAHGGAVADTLGAFLNVSACPTLGRRAAKGQAAFRAALRVASLAGAGWCCGWLEPSGKAPVAVAASVGGQAWALPRDGIADVAAVHGGQKVALAGLTALCVVGSKIVVLCLA